MSAARRWKSLLAMNALLFCGMRAANSNRPAPKRWRVVVLLGVFVLTSAALWKLNRPEPIHANQPLSYWMARMADPATSAQASSVLTELGPEAIPTLVDALHTRSSPTMDFVHDAAAKIKLAAPRTYDAPNIRATAAFLLGQLGTNAAPAVPHLVESLGDKDPIVQVKAIRALAQIGEPAVPELSRGLTHPEPAIRFGAAKALAAIRK